MKVGVALVAPMNAAVLVAGAETMVQAKLTGVPSGSLPLPCSVTATPTWTVRLPPASATGEGSPTVTVTVSDVDGPPTVVTVSVTT